jgi:predicted nucleotidyltransferase
LPIGKGAALAIPRREWQSRSIVSSSAARTAELLRERESRLRASRDARAAAVRGGVRRAFSALEPHTGPVWLIGSLAWGGFGERSDVDLVVSHIDRQRADDLERAVAKATGVFVDLLFLDELPAAFRERVEREGERLA